MPQQKFVLSYLLYPVSYEKEVLGVSVPLSFSITDREGYVLNYFPYGLWTGTKMTSMMLAERKQMMQDAMDSSLLLGDISYKDSSVKFPALFAEDIRHYESQVHYLSFATTKERYDSQLNVLTQALTEQQHISQITLLKSGITEKRHEAELKPSLSLAEKLVFYRNGHIEKGTIEAERYQLTHLAEYFHPNLLAEPYVYYKEVLLSTQFVLSEEYHDREAEVVPFSILSDKKYPQKADIRPLFLEAYRDTRQTSILVSKNIHATRTYQKSSLPLTRMMQMVRESRGARYIRKVIKAAKESRSGKYIKRYVLSKKESHGAKIVTKRKWGSKEGYTSSQMTRLVYAALVKNEAMIDSSMTSGHWEKVPTIGLLNDPFILAHYGTIEAAIQQAILYMDRAGIAGDFLDAVLADTKGEHDSLLAENLLADTKEEHDSVISTLISSDRRERESEWIESVICALLNVNSQEAFIDRFIEFGDDKGKEAFIAALHEQGEKPKKETLLKELKLALNVSKPNRPAGMTKMTIAEWDIGFDDLLSTWKPGWDYLDAPDKDYNYEGNIPNVYDENGVPLDPLGPTNLPDVDVKLAINHPLTEFKDIGVGERWVDLHTYQDVLINLAIIWKKEKARLAEMNGQQAHQFVLRELLKQLQEATPWGKDYQRVFRFVRWYAERIVQKDSITVLHRTYDDWRDNILSYGGQFLYPHLMDQMTTIPLGTIESTSTLGYLTFNVENYIDGTITFSSVISSANAASTSQLVFYIDGVMTQAFTVSDGVQRLSFDVPMGAHSYRWEYTAEVGDIVKLSGFQISGVVFKEASTTQKDAGTIRGIAAVDHLIQALLTYYQKHHKDKAKGAIGVYQRKIWLT